MTDRYTVINRDTLEAMHHAGYVAKLEARIEQLEAALREIIGTDELSFVPPTLRDIARKALEGKDE